jgi:hypothetical protein
MSVPKRSQAFPEHTGTHPFPAFPIVPPLKGGGNVGNGIGTVRRGASDLVPMPPDLCGEGAGGLHCLVALCGRGVAE